MGELEGAGAREATPDDRFKVIRELGSHKTPTFAARMRDAAGERLVVVERFARITLGETPIEPVVAAARVIAGLQHTNLALVREFTVGRDVITTASDFIDGELLSELLDEGTQIPLPISLRVLTDVCTALTVLHAMRGPGGQTMPTAHGEVVSSNIVLGVDGVARLIRACRPRAPGASLPNDFAALPPEVLEGRPADARSDVYSVAALMWQAMSAEVLFEGADPQTIVECVRGAGAPRARVPEDEPWAAPLVEVIARALSASPDKRPSSAGMLAGEIRKIAGPKLATVARVAAFMKGAAGGKIAVRRALLESGSTSGIPPRGPAAAAPAAAAEEVPPPSSSSGGAIALDDDDVEPMSVRPDPQALRPVAKPMALPSKVPTLSPVHAAKPHDDWSPPPPSGAKLLADADVPPLAKGPPGPPPMRPKLPSSSEPTPPPSRMAPLAPPLHLSLTPQVPKAAPKPPPAKPPPPAPAAKPAPGKPPVPVPSRVATLIMNAAPPPPTINPMVEPEPPPPPAPSVAEAPARPDEATPFAFARADGEKRNLPANGPRAVREKPVVAVDLPPVRQPMTTEPSIVMLDKARSARRRMALAVTTVVVLAAAVVCVWRFVPRDTSDTGPAATGARPTDKRPPPPATTAEPAPTETATAAEPSPPATDTAAPPATAGTATAAPPDTGSATVAPPDTGAPTTQPTAPTVTATATGVPTSTAPQPTVVAPPGTTVAPTAAPTPAPTPKPPPPKPTATFDPTRI